MEKDDIEDLKILIFKLLEGPQMAKKAAIILKDWIEEESD